LGWNICRADSGNADLFLAGLTASARKLLFLENIANAAASRVGQFTLEEIPGLIDVRGVIARIIIDLAKALPNLLFAC
jgi:hypothetical protein